MGLASTVWPLLARWTLASSWDVERHGPFQIAFDPDGCCSASNLPGVSKQIYSKSNPKLTKVSVLIACSPCRRVLAQLLKNRLQVLGTRGVDDIVITLGKK